MNRMIRGVAGLLVALGASACSSDYGLDFETEPTQIQASPEVMFITSGAAAKELLLRLTNDINQGVPTTFTISNVPAGLTVTHDDNYRPDYVNPDGTLQQPSELVQQRYYVSANMPTGGQVSFTVSSGGFSKDITVRVLPTDLGSALSSTAPAVGEEVTITAPANLSFTSASTVNIPGGGNAVITAQDAKSITFIPIPGSSGVATVTNVTLDYAPTLNPVTLATTATIDVPAVTSIPLAYSKTTLGSAETVTVTATGFRFESGASFTYGGKKAFVVSVSGDGTSATILPPPNLAGAAATVSGVHLSFLTSVSLSNIASSATITTAGFPTLAGTANPDGSAPVKAVQAVGTGIFFADVPTWSGADIIGGGGPLAFYKITVAAAGTRHFEGDWTVAGDVDVYVVNEAVSAFVNTAGGTSAHPETFNQALAAATNYWVVGVLYDGPSGGNFLVTIK